MKCGHCGVSFHPRVAGSCAQSANDSQVHGFEVEAIFCPECLEPTILLKWGVIQFDPDYGYSLKAVATTDVIYPKTPVRVSLPVEVPEEFRQDFNEAAELLPISSKASAAMSRRLLQRVLRDRYGIKKHSLSAEIEEFLGLAGIPTEIADAVDAIRQIGNFAAHPEKGLATGGIVEVEPGEAEWSLDTLEALLDVAFVQPKRLAVRRTALNEKLAQLSKAPLKNSRRLSEELVEPQENA